MGLHPAQLAHVGRRYRSAPLGVFLAGIAVMSTTASCSHAHDEPRTWADVAASLLEEGTPSDVEAGVLADGLVTDTEYEEAVRRYLRCATEHGVTIEARQGSHGLYSYRWDATQPDVTATCAEGTTRMVEAIYSGQTTNPGMRPYGEIIPECWVRRGAVDPAVTLEDARIAFANGTYDTLHVVDADLMEACLENPSA